LACGGFPTSLQNKIKYIKLNKRSGFMLNPKKTIALTVIMSLAACTPALAASAGNDTDINNIASMALNNCNAAVIQQIQTNVNIVNNVNINVDTSNAGKVQSIADNISDVNEIRAQSNRLRAGYGIK
jgi:hypothetical protein